MSEIIQFFEILGALIGFFFLFLLEYTRKRVLKGPLGTFFALYSHKYFFSVEFGVLFLTTSFLISLTARLEKFAAPYNTLLDFAHQLLLVLAMAIFALSGKIFLQEVEKMLKHREQKKKSFEKMLAEKSKQMQGEKGQEEKG